MSTVFYSVANHIEQTSTIALLGDAIDHGIFDALAVAGGELRPSLFLRVLDELKQGGFVQTKRGVELAIRSLGVARMLKEPRFDSGFKCSFRCDLARIAHGRWLPFLDGISDIYLSSYGG